MKRTSLLSGIPNKREYLAQTLGRLGLLGLLERATAMRRPGLIVLTYHRIADPARNPFYDPVISATPESFRTQLKWLTRHIRLLNCAEVITQVESSSRWRETAVLLTFDDGYRDNFDVALPILREFKAPALFLIPTAFLNSPALPWWDHIAYVFKQTKIRQFTLRQKAGPDDASPPLEINLEIMPPSAAIMTVVRAFLHGTITDERWFLEQLCQLAEVELDAHQITRGLLMSWDQVQSLASLGAHFAIGAHSHSHRNLATLDENSQRDELTQSKQILEQRLKREISVLAYPYGWPGTYSTLTKVLTAEAGYHLAFSSRERINRPGTLDRFDIGRLSVGLGDTLALLRARTVFQAAFGASLL
jgi:peptidoglycan/xylan/chitin deacetylase (PgdA/CDA1 family)